MKKIFLFAALIAALFTPINASAQIAENPVSGTASGGLRTSQVNHIVVCDSFYSTVQECFTAAGTNRSVIIPFGQHTSETFTNPNGIVFLDLRTPLSFNPPAATSTVAGGVQLATGQTSYVLSKVATTGTYSDLTGLPNLGSVQINTVSSPLSFSAGTLSCPSCGSGGGGTGTVTGLSTGTTPSWLSLGIANATTTPVLSLTATAIPNIALQNSFTTVNGQVCPLGGTCTITGASSSITGTANQLGLIGAGGASITNSSINVAQTATFTAVSNKTGLLTSVAFTSGVPLAGQTVQGTGTTAATTIYSVTDVPLSVSGSTTSGSAVMTVTTTSGLYTGELITGAGIPTGATLSCANTVSPPTCDAGTSITLSSPATTTGSSTYAAQRYSINLTSATTVGSSSAPVQVSLTALASITMPMDIIVNSISGMLLSSSFSSYPGAANGIVNALASPGCSLGCTVLAGPNNTSTTPNSSLPSSMHLTLMPNGEVSEYFHNSASAHSETYSTSINQGTGQAFHNEAFNPAATGWDNGFGGDGTSHGEYGNNLSFIGINSHTASIFEGESISGTISEPGDINFKNVNMYLNPYSFSDSSENVTVERLYVFSAPPFLGSITTGGIGATTLNFNCWSGRGCNDMSIYTPLIDLTTDVLSGTGTLNSNVALGLNGLVGVVTTNFTVPVSINALLPAQLNAQGILFAASTASGGSKAAESVTIQFLTGTSTADASAICGGGPCGNTVTVVLTNSSGGNRTLSDIVNLFTNYPPTTTSGGVITAFLTPAATGTTVAAVMAPTALGGVNIPVGSAGVLTTFAITNPTVNSTSLCGGAAPCPFAPVPGAIMDIVGPYYNEVTSPTIVSSPVNSTYAVTSLLYLSHSPTYVFANTSATPGSGMVGRAFDVTAGTSIDSEDRITQIIFGSTSSNTIWVGTTINGGFNVRGMQNGVPVPITVYHAATIRTLLNPSNTGYLVGSYGNGKDQGTYATVEANDTFAVGDMVENTSGLGQNWTYHKEWADIENPYASWNQHIIYLNGPGLNGSVFNILNQNPSSMYSKYGLSPLSTFQVVQSQIQSNVGTFYDTFGYPYQNQLSVGQSVTLNGFPAGSSSAYLNGQALTVASVGTTTQSVTGTTTLNSQTITATTATGLYGGEGINGTGIPTGSTISCASATINPPYCDTGTTFKITPLPATVTGTSSFTVSAPYFTASLTSANAGPFTDVGSIYGSTSVTPPTFLNWSGDMNSLITLDTIPTSLITVGNGYGGAIWPLSQTSMSIVSIGPHCCGSGALVFDNIPAVTTGYSLSTTNSTTSITVQGAFSGYTVNHTVNLQAYGASTFLNNTNWILTAVSGSSITATSTSNALITSSNAYSISGNVLTVFEKSSSLTTGQKVQLSGYPTSTFLNGPVLTIASIVNSAGTITGTLTSGSKAVTVTSAAGVYNGESISGTGVASGSTVSCVASTTNPPYCDAGTTFNLSLNATASGSTTLTATAQYFTAPFTNANAGAIESGNVYRATSGLVSEAGQTYTTYFNFNGETNFYNNIFGAKAFFSSTVAASGFSETLSTPASSSATCTTGQFWDDANFHYVCTATNTIKRAALSTF